MKNLLLVVLILCSEALLAQDDQYIVTLQNDTIRGKVIISKYSNVVQQVSVKVGKKRSTYKAHQVKSIKKTKEIYHTLRIKQQYQFALLKKAGYLSYYKYSRNTASTSLSFDTPILYKSTTELRDVPNIGFKKQISAFLSDCETTKSKLETGEYGRNDLEKIIDEYNQCVTVKTELQQNQLIEIKQKLSKAEKIIEIKTAVSQSTKVGNTDELTDILSDVESKLKHGDTIPEYLKSVLKDKLSSEPEIFTKLLKIIE